MNNALIRIMTIAVLATSMSPIGVSQQTKAADNSDQNNTNGEETAVPSAVQQHYSDSIDDLKQEIAELRHEIEGLREEEQNSRKIQQQQIKQQEQEWLHYLQNLSPG